MEKYICIHGHFYQPPRENAWLEEVELQDSAYPYHDWNEKITAECYAPNTASRIVDSKIKILEIINNYSQISFNVGPTLFYWLEKHRPEVYEAIIEADKISQNKYSGHGSAIAQVYNHMIMPLANRRDKETQVYWGIKDFEKRFGRYPEGMWLPETAVDIESLEVLANHEIKFTILAPSQAKKVKHITKGARWHELKNTIDPKKPYICNLPSGKSIVIFFYDGTVSQEVAFGGLLNDGKKFAERLLSQYEHSTEHAQLVHIATDGESYGHHHKYGEMALSYCLYHIKSVHGVKLTNYGHFLEKYPPSDQVEISEKTSWSCFHGIERWRDNCGCNTESPADWTQSWRKPLREALDNLRDELILIYKEEASSLFKDPWQARNDYIEIIHDRSFENVLRFLDKVSLHKLTEEEKIKALKLLGMQRNAMLMFTSCGWFFNDISGIETTQILQYAAKAISYAEELSDRQYEERFIEKLIEAKSNVYENGGKVYDLFITPAKVDLLRVAAHYGILSLFVNHAKITSQYCFTISCENHIRKEAGRFKLSIGKIRVRADFILEEKTICFAAIHFGDQNICGGVRLFHDDGEFNKMQDEHTGTFEKGNMTEILRHILKYFGTNNYTLLHLFKEEQRKIIKEILEETMNNIDAIFSNIHEESAAIMNFLKELNYPIPQPFILTAEYYINTELQKKFINNSLDILKLKTLIEHVNKFSLKVDRPGLSYAASKWIAIQMEILNRYPDRIDVIDKIIKTIELLEELKLDLNLWKSQNIYFILSRTKYKDMKYNQASDAEKTQWLESFKNLGTHLHVRVE